MFQLNTCGREPLSRQELAVSISKYGSCGEVGSEERFDVQISEGYDVSPLA